MHFAPLILLSVVAGLANADAVLTIDKNIIVAPLDNLVDEHTPRAFPPNRDVNKSGLKGDDDDGDDEFIVIRRKPQQPALASGKAKPEQDRPSNKPRKAEQAQGDKAKQEPEEQLEREDGQSKEPRKEEQPKEDKANQQAKEQQHHKKPHHDCPVCTLKPKPEPKKCEFYVTHELVPACEAQAACERVGLKLADLRTDNWERAAKAMFEGVGPNGYGWVHSWNDDAYPQAPCVAFYTGLTERGGAINVPVSCLLPRPALCQRGIRFH
jgi:hypothetical protein